MNQGGHRFVERRRLGVADAGWAWGTDMADFNNDGRLDIVAANGTRIWSRI
ncbi:MAG: VCBS repeat-containing protein [Caldilineaceae bacterium]